MPFGKKKTDSDTATGVALKPAGDAPGKVIVNGETFFEVEKIISKKIDKKGRKLYLVKWKGYGQADNTWEPISNLETVPDLIDEFEKTHKDSSSKDITKPKVTDKITKTPSGTLSGMKALTPASPVALGRQGSFAHGDEAMKVSEFTLQADKKKPTLADALFKVEWKKKGADKPASSDVSAKDLRKFAPEVLLDFYEERITFLWDEDDTTH